MIGKPSGSGGDIGGKVSLITKKALTGNAARAFALACRFDEYLYLASKKPVKVCQNV